ncbi:MAG: extracellular solute-binding protein [Candidatus Promineifilaceae bacterium]
MKNRIGRYTIIRELGRGGMATVYLANDPNFDREVAIKVLPSQFLHDPQFRTRFEREAKTIAALEHPAIVPVYDFGEELEQPYIVMCYMQGGDLAHKLENGALSLVEVATIVNRLAAALDSAHDRKIIHRDLKPGNILFDQYDNAYLSDFGIVKLKEQNATFTGNAIIGTPTYMSPEQAKGSAEIDGRSDLYALGVIIYEMLTGAVPYQGETAIQLMMKHILDPVPRILEVNAALPAEIGRIVSRTLSKNPDDRYPSSVRLSEALNQAAGLGSGFHRQSNVRPATPAGGTVVDLGTVLDGSAFDDEDDEWEVPAVGSQTILDDAAFDDEDDEWDKPIPGSRTALDDAASDDKPADPAKGRVGMGVTVLDDSDEGYTLFDETDDLLASGANQDTDWLAEASVVVPQPRPPTRNQTTQKPNSRSTPVAPPISPIVPPVEEDNKRPIVWIIGGIVALLAVVGGLAFALGGGGGTTEVTEEPTIAVVADVTETPTDDAPLTPESVDEPTLTPVVETAFAPVAGEFGGGGELIAFQTQKGNGGWNIGVMNLDGSNRIILTDDSSNDQRPRWSPDGMWIMFRSDRSGNEDMWMMQPDGSEVQQLTTQPLADHTGAFSPDGTLLAYHADFDGEGVASIAIMPAEGGEPTRLTSLDEGNSYWPNWSSDGKRLTFWTLRNDGAAELYLMDADGTNQRPLLKNNGAYLDPIWSPVTDEIAYYAYGASGRAELFLISAETKQITPVNSKVEGNNILSDWSPDGDWLLIHSDFHGADEIYAVRTDGSEQRRMTNTSSDDQHPVWQPINRVERPIELADAPEIDGELIVWHSFEGDPLALIAASFERLQAENQGLVISAEFIPSDEIRERYEAASADGSSPDVLFAPIDWGGEFLASGLVQDPLPLLSDSAAQRIGETHLNRVLIGSEAVAVPILTRGIVLMRNQSIVPTARASFSDIVALGSSAYDLERGLYYSGGMLPAVGGQLMDAAGQPTFNNEAGVTWLNTLKQFNDPQSYGDQDLEAFEQGEIGLILEGTWNMGRAVNAIGRENLVIDPWPSGMSGYVIYDVAYVRTGLKFEKRPLVTALLDNMLSAPLQTTLADRSQIPVVDDATVNIDLVRQAQTTLATGVALPITSAMAHYWEPLTIAINEVVDNGVDPAAALDDASAEIKRALP